MRQRLVMSGGIIKSASAHAADLDKELQQLRTQNAALRELLQEVANSGVEYDDPRCHYTLMQIDNKTLADIRAALEVK